VFIMDSEELVGAKQNRVLNLTVLAPAGKTLILPVSCVEQGRWAYRTREFAPAPHVMYSEGRAMKTAQVSSFLGSSGAPMSDQSELWAELDQKSARMGVRSASGAMSDIFEQRSSKVEEYVRNLCWTEGQIGALFAVSGRLTGLDLFGYTDTMKQLLPKIVRSYALDAVEEQDRPEQEIAQSVVEDFLKAVGESAVETFPAVGLGQDLRLSSPGLTGGGLALEERLIHLSAFRTPGSGAQNEETSSSGRGFGRMLRASMRRRRS
jgi:hypothetical protein